MKHGTARIFLCLPLLFTGCQTPRDPAERGPDGTIAYHVKVTTSEPGARIEANGEDMGFSPLTLRIHGDEDGTFHNFGSDTYIIRAYPVRPGQRLQTKVFRTGGWFAPEDRIPSAVYFDLGLEPVVDPRP